MYVDVNSIEELIEEVEYGQLLKRIDIKIDRMFPKQNRRIFNNGKTFTAIVYGINPVPTKGYEGAGVLNLTPLKNGVSLHCYQFIDGENVFNRYAINSQLPKSAIGQGCLKIKSDAFLDKYEEVIDQLLLEITSELSSM